MPAKKKPKAKAAGKAKPRKPGKAQKGPVKAKSKPKRAKPLPAKQKALERTLGGKKRQGKPHPKAAGGRKAPTAKSASISSNTDISARALSTSAPGAETSSAPAVLVGLALADIKIRGTTAFRHRLQKFERKWYVIAVEPGADRRVRKDIRLKRAVNNLEAHIGRIVCPTKVEEVQVNATYELVDQGECPTAQEAKKTALVTAWLHFEGEESPDLRDRPPKHDPEGYRTTIHPTKGKEKGKVGNTWTWKVSRVTEARKTAARNVLKFPGYVLIFMVWDETTHHVIKKVRGVWGFLPLPVPTGPRPTRAEQEALESWVPTALDTEEAAELLIQQAEESKKLKESKTTALKFGVGATVIINDGAFVDMPATVRKITGDREPLVTVDVNFLGRIVPVTVRADQVALSNRSE